MIMLKKCTVEIFNSGDICWIMFNPEDQSDEDMIRMGRGTPMSIDNSRMMYNYKGIMYYSS